MPKRNAFDLLRLFLATLVLISHAYLLGGFGKEPLMIFSKNQTYLAEIGVIGFFALSGYLITGSFDRNPNPFIFLWHRLLRILPGLWFCLLVSAFILAPMLYYINSNSISGFSITGSGSAVSYVLSNSLLKVQQWSINNILNNSDYKISFNGSLWTLFPEFQCYLLTLILGISGLITSNRKTLALIFILTYLFYIVNLTSTAYSGPTFLILSKAFPLYLSYLTGSMLYLFRNELAFDKKELTIIAFCFLLVLKFGGFLLVAPVIIPILFIGIFSLYSVRLKVDLSYGLYIYGFPVEILTNRLFGQSLNFIGYFAISLAATALLALLSNLLVEKPFLRLKNLFNRPKPQTTW